MKEMKISSMNFFELNKWFGTNFFLSVFVFNNIEIFKNILSYVHLTEYLFHPSRFCSWWLLKYNTAKQEHLWQSCKVQCTCKSNSDNKNIFSEVQTQKLLQIFHNAEQMILLSFYRITVINIRLYFTANKILKLTRCQNLRPKWRLDRYWWSALCPSRTSNMLASWSRERWELFPVQFPSFCKAKFRISAVSLKLSSKLVFDVAEHFEL